MHAAGTLLNNVFSVELPNLLSAWTSTIHRQEGTQAAADLAQLQEITRRLQQSTIFTFVGAPLNFSTIATLITAISTFATLVAQHADVKYDNALFF